MTYGSRNLNTNHDSPIVQSLDVSVKNSSRTSSAPEPMRSRPRVKEWGVQQYSVLPSIFQEDITGKYAMKARDKLLFSAAMNSEYLPSSVFSIDHRLWKLKDLR